MAQLVTGWVDVAGTHCSGGGVAGGDGVGAAHSWRTLLSPGAVRDSSGEDALDSVVME